MGAADDIRNGLAKNLANFTKQRKAEEKHVSAGRWRVSRMTEVRGMFLKEAAEEVMEECYLKASGNGSLPATARQIFYVARPLIEARTDKPLLYSYFSQTLLPNYIYENGAQHWDVVYDDRGHFMEPHTKRIIGLGTLNVRGYLSKVDDLQFKDADFAAASVKTYGPDGSFGAVLYVEKEGFMPLFERVRLAQRYDIAIMSSKGMSVTAARLLIDDLEPGVPLLVLHDFDSAGIIIKDTLHNDTRRFTYGRLPTVIDLGLHYGDIGGLAAEPNNSNISDQRLAEAGLDPNAIAFLRSQRVELNAMTSRQLVDFVEAKLQQSGIRKVIPKSKTLAETYQMFVKSDRLEKAFDGVQEKLEAESAAPIEVPHDLQAKVEQLLQERPEITWHRAVQLVVDPDSPDPEGDEQEQDDDDAGDEDLSDIEE
jgi:Topoisomerase 6 subunit A/Spo11, Toprim domain